MRVDSVQQCVPSEVHEHAEFIRAWLDDFVVEYSYNGHNYWQTVHDLLVFSLPNVRFRIRAKN